MAKKKAHKKKFPWRTLEPYRYRKRRRYVGARKGGIRVDALEGQWFFLVLGVPWLIVGIGFAVKGIAIAFSIVSIVLGIICCLISFYAFLSRREDLKIEAEKQAARDEKQRLWREKRRAELTAKKKRK